jgi:hypothetical protein
VAYNKKIIGWGELPDFPYYEANIPLINSIGFDGLVLAPTYKKAGNDYPIYLDVWSSTINIPWGSIKPLWNFLPPPSNNLSENFLRFNVTPDIVDWFDPGMSNVMANFIQMAILAKSSHCVGIMMDPEAYASQVWQYSTQPNAGSYTVNQYEAQVKLFAYNMGKAIWGIFPDLVFYVAFGYAVALEDPGQKIQYQLYPYFLDGLINAAGEFPCAKVVIGNEFSYSCTTDACFEDRGNRSGTGIYKGSSPYFDSRASIGMWMELNASPFDNTTPNANYFTPLNIPPTIELGLKYAAKYFVVYSGGWGWFRTTCWPWSCPGFPIRLNTMYANCINTAQALLI